MLRNRFDLASKDLLRVSLEPDGRFETDAEASAPAQHIDGWFIPDPARPPTRNRLGLLGDLTREACSFEPFHATPGAHDVSECIRKLLNFRHALSLRDPAPPLPSLRLISSGRPDDAIEGFAFHPPKGWPDGIYHAAPRLFTVLVVVSELREVRETLFLRLMGAGQTLKRATAELLALPRGAIEHTLAMPVLVRYRLDVPADPKKRTREDEEFLMNTHDIVEAWEREKRSEGLTAGLTAGLAKGLREAAMDAYEARFGAMPADLVAVLGETQEEGTLRRLVKLVATGTPEQVRERLLPGRTS